MWESCDRVLFLAHGLATHRAGVGRVPYVDRWLLCDVVGLVDGAKVRVLNEVGWPCMLESGFRVGGSMGVGTANCARAGGPLVPFLACLPMRDKGRDRRLHRSSGDLVSRVDISLSALVGSPTVDTHTYRSNIRSNYIYRTL